MNFIIDLNVFLLECDDDNINSYVDDFTTCSCSKATFSVITKLQGIVQIFLRWYGKNHMKVNPGKNHVVLSSKIQIAVPLDNIQIKSSFTKKVLAITFNLELKFQEHISKIYLMSLNLMSLHRREKGFR